MSNSLAQYLVPLTDKINEALRKSKPTVLSTVQKEIEPYQDEINKILNDVGVLREKFGELVLAIYHENNPFSQALMTENEDARFQRGKETFMQILGYSLVAGNKSILDWAINYVLKNSKLCTDRIKYANYFKSMIDNWDQYQAKFGLSDETLPYVRHLSKRFTTEICANLH